MKFSVLINNYNYAPYLQECVDSVLAQAFSPYEIIIVDDGSTDGSVELLQAKYGRNTLVKIISQPNSGQFAAIDRGIQTASGDIVCLLDADDRYKPEYLATLNELYQAKPEVDLVFCRFDILGGAISATKNSIWLAPESDYDYGITALLTYFYFKDRSTFWTGNVTSCVSLRMSYARQAQLDELGRQWNDPIQADYALLLGMSLLGARKYYLAKNLIEYRLHDNNRWANGVKLTARQRQNNRIRYRTIFNFYKEKAGLQDEAIRHLLDEIKTVPQPLPEHIRAYHRLNNKFYWKNGRLHHRKGILKRIKDLRWVFDK